MVKLTFCLRRLPHLSRSEFQAYWRGTHADLVAERSEVLRIRRYVQVHTADMDGLHRAFQARNLGAPEAFDGVAELWFDSVDDLTSDASEVRAAAAELLADEKNFIDLERSPMWVSEEHEIVGG